MSTNQIEVHRGDAGRPYEELGAVKARKGAQPTPFNKRPSEDEVTIKLRAKAQKMGATGVINVQYKPGIIPSSWRGMTATGTAVRFT